MNLEEFIFCKSSFAKIPNECLSYEAKKKWLKKGNGNERKTEIRYVRFNYYGSEGA